MSHIVQAMEPIALLPVNHGDKPNVFVIPGEFVQGGLDLRQRCEFLHSEYLAQRLHHVVWKIQHCFGVSVEILELEISFVYGPQ